MIILIEGPDGTGKTTLAHRLCQEYGLQYLHFGIPDEHPMDYWFKTLVTINRPTVIDRLHLSEEVYGPIYRESSQLSSHDYWLIEGWLWARDGCVVVCKVPKPLMYSNQLASKGEYHDIRQERVYADFGKKILQTSLTFSIFDYTTDPEPIVNIDLPMPVEWSDHGMGSVCPNVWLVGEKHGPDSKPRVFVDQTCFQGGSGKYLRETIELLGWRWNSYHLSNSLTRQGGPINLRAKWARLEYPRVVALGKVASRVLTGFKIPHSQVSHPQYWRRFKNHDMHGYANEIYKAC